MRSKAQIEGHPIHPAIVAFPIAFLYGAFVFDAVGLAMGWRTWQATGSYLSIAGIATAVLAAVPGLIDYFGVVPPHSSAKKRATWHMGVNLTAVACFLIAWIFRDRHWMPGTSTALWELLGIVCMTAGGWMGGTLVYRNQIGVDHRYAEAGRWKEATVERREGEPMVVARADELKVNQMKLLHVGDQRIVLARTETGYTAFDDHCTHRGGSLADGTLACGTVECPWHGSQFDVNTGHVKAGPATQAIRSYTVVESEGQVKLMV